MRELSEPQGLHAPHSALSGALYRGIAWQMGEKPTFAQHRACTHHGQPDALHFVLKMNTQAACFNKIQGSVHQALRDQHSPWHHGKALHVAGHSNPVSSHDGTQRIFTLVLNKCRKQALNIWLTGKAVVCIHAGVLEVGFRDYLKPEQYELARAALLFANAKAGEYYPQQIVRSELSGDFTQGILSKTKFLSQEIQ